MMHVHTVLSEEQINWAAHLKVTSWVLMKMCIPWNPKVMLQFVQYSDGECELRDGIIGNFYSYTSMVLYWGVWLCMELENLLGDQNHWWQLIMWCIVRVSSCQADARWMRSGAVNPPVWLVTNAGHKLNYRYNYQ